MELTNLDEIKDLLTENHINFVSTDFIPAGYNNEQVPAILIEWDLSYKVIDLLNETGIYFGSEKQYNQMVIY
jgi:hypothetical protein